MKVLYGKKNVILFSTAILAILIIVFIINSLWSIFHNVDGDIQQTEIDIYNCFGSYSSKNIALSDIIEKYCEKNPKVKISNTSISTDEFYTKLNADFTADCGADIVIAPPSYDIFQLYKRGYIAPLNTEFTKDAEWADTFDKNILRFVTDSGSIYGLPTDIEYILLFCNTEILKRYGLDTPKSYADLKNAVSVISGSNIVPISFASNDTDLYLYQILTSMLDDDAYSAENRNPNNGYAQAMEYMKELYSMGAFAKNYETMSQNDANNMFLNGSAAMIVTTNSFIDNITQYANTDAKDYTKYINQFEIIAFPSEMQEDNQTKIVFSTVSYNAGEFTIFVSKKAYENKHDEVMELAKYLTKPKALRSYLAQTNDIMSIKYIENKEYKTRLVANCKLAAETATKFTSMPIDITYRYIWRNQLGKRIPRIFEDLLTFDDVAAKMNYTTQINDYKKRNERD